MTKTTVAWSQNENRPVYLVNGKPLRHQKAGSLFTRISVLKFCQLLEALFLYFNAEIAIE